MNSYIEMSKSSIGRKKVRKLPDSTAIQLYTANPACMIAVGCNYVSLGKGLNKQPQ